jgi:ribosomal protein S18 acetylase RimI-like enzyme
MSSGHPLDLRPADQVPAEVLHALFREAFADYLIGPFEVPLSQWPAFLARQGATLPLSRVAFDATGQALAFALVAERPLHRRWRLATMGARPQARGTGAAGQLLDDFLLRATAHGQQAVELEVFAQNERARRLYESRGFEAIHPLQGWQGELAAFKTSPASPPLQPIHRVREDDVSREAPAPSETPGAQDVAGLAATPPQSVDMAAALHWLDAAERRWSDLPLQVTRSSLQHLAEAHAWQIRTGDASATAQVVFTLPDETVMVNSFIAPDPRDAAALIQALARVYPQRRLRVPQLQRDDLGGQCLRDLGATPLPLHQLWMCRALTPPARP